MINIVNIIKSFNYGEPILYLYCFEYFINRSASMFMFMLLFLVEVCPHYTWFHQRWFEEWSSRDTEKIAHRYCVVACMYSKSHLLMEVNKDVYNMTRLLYHTYDMYNHIYTLLYIAHTYIYIYQSVNYKIAGGHQLSAKS